MPDGTVYVKALLVKMPVKEAGGAGTGIIMTRPSPPFPAKDLSVLIPGKPPIPAPLWYWPSPMLYVKALPEVEPEAPAMVKKVFVDKQPPT